MSWFIKISSSWHKLSITTAEESTTRCHNWKSTSQTSNSETKRRKMTFLFVSCIEVRRLHPICVERWGDVLSGFILFFVLRWSGNSWSVMSVKCLLCQNVFNRCFHLPSWALMCKMCRNIVWETDLHQPFLEWYFCLCGPQTPCFSVHRQYDILQAVKHHGSWQHTAYKL